MVVPNCLHGRRDSAYLGDRKCIYHFTPLTQCTVGDLLSLVVYTSLYRLLQSSWNYIVATRRDNIDDVTQQVLSLFKTCMVINVTV